MKAQRTRKQDRILNLLKSLNRGVSAQDIYVELRSREQSIGLTTIYRSLEALKLEGAVQVRTLASGESLYGCVQQDKHHLTCLQCGASFTIDQCPVHQLETHLQHSYQFKIYYHTLEFFGLCDRCDETEASDQVTESSKIGSKTQTA